MHLGDESFGYEYAEESKIVFRKANIVVSIEYYKQYGSARLSNTNDLAETVEKKIVKNFGKKGDSMNVAELDPLWVLKGG